MTQGVNHLESCRISAEISRSGSHVWRILLIRSGPMQCLCVPGRCQLSVYFRLIASQEVQVSDRNHEASLQKINHMLEKNKNFFPFYLS